MAENKSGKPTIEYHIVMNDGTGRDGFLERFREGWAVILHLAAGDAVHYVIRKEGPMPYLAANASESALIPAGFFKGKRER